MPLRPSQNKCHANCPALTSGYSCDLKRCTGTFAPCFAVFKDGSWVQLRRAACTVVSQYKSPEVSKLLSLGILALSFTPGNGEEVRLSDLTKAVEKIGEQEAKKDTSEVAPSTGDSDGKLHGGNNASKEVKDSPNAAKGGESVKNLGLTAENVKKLAKASKNSAYHGKHPKGGGGLGQLHLMPEEKLAASDKANIKEAANLLAKIIGRGKPEETNSIGYTDLVLAMQRGEDLRRYLDVDVEKENSLRILITVDSSGSTCWQSGFTVALAKYLSSMPNLDVEYVKNFNGSINFRDMDAAELSSFDVMIYIGDDDGKNLILESHSKKVFCLGMSNVKCNVGTPNITERSKNAVWVESVSGKDSGSILRAIKEVYKNK